MGIRGDGERAPAAIGSQMTASVFAPLLYVYSCQMKPILLLASFLHSEKRKTRLFSLILPATRCQSLHFAAESSAFSPGEAEANISHRGQESRAVALLFLLFIF